MNIAVSAHPYNTLSKSTHVREDLITWLSTLRDAGITTFAPFIMIGERHFFESSILGTPTWEYLSIVLEEAHRFGMEVHGTVTTGSTMLKLGKEQGRGRYIPVDIAGRNEKLPEWAEEWFCPAWEEGRAETARMVADLVSRHDMDGVNLDYIRYTNSTVSANYPCGCVDCRRERKKWLGKEMPDADEWQLPGYRYKEIEMRTGFIDDLIGQVSKAIRRGGARVSVDARARYLKDAVPEGQDWAKWAREGLIDMMWPMSYNPCIDRFSRFLDEQAPLLEGTSAEYWPGIGRVSSMGSMDAPMMIRQIELAFEKGAHGIYIFSAGALEQSDYDALRALTQRG